MTNWKVQYYIRTAFFYWVFTICQELWVYYLIQFYISEGGAYVYSHFMDAEMEAPKK